MTISYKLKDKAKLAKLEKDSYTVLGYGEQSNGSKIYLVANDALQITEILESVVENIGEDFSHYLNNPQLNFGRGLYVETNFANYIKGFSQHDLVSNHIWNLSKLSRFFIDNNYFLPQEYKNTVLNVTYKMNLIEGFLIFANFYINIRNSDGMYWETLLFYKADSIDAIVDEKFKEEKTVTNIEVGKYETELINFIKKHLYDQSAYEMKSEDICNELYKLLDSIFINGPKCLFIVETFYDECFVVEYDDCYYCFNKIWGS